MKPDVWHVLVFVCFPQAQMWVCKMRRCDMKLKTVYSQETLILIHIFLFPLLWCLWREKNVLAHMFYWRWCTQHLWCTSHLMAQNRKYKSVQSGYCYLNKLDLSKNLTLVLCMMLCESQYLPDYKAWWTFRAGKSCVRNDNIMEKSLEKAVTNLEM